MAMLCISRGSNAPQRKDDIISSRVSIECLGILWYIVISLFHVLGGQVCLRVQISTARPGQNLPTSQVAMLFSGQEEIRRWLCGALAFSCLCSEGMYPLVN